MSQDVDEDLLAKLRLKNTPSYIKAKDLAFVDCETTGVHRLREIIEIAIIRGGEVFESKVRVSEYDLRRGDLACTPGRKTWREVTGYTDAEWADAPDVHQVAPVVAKMLNGCTIVGHNVTFDLASIASMLSRVGIPPAAVWGEYPTLIDTMPLAYAQLSAAGLGKRINLDVVCDLLGIEKEGVHRAMGGAARAQLVLRRLAQAVKRGLAV